MKGAVAIKTKLWPFVKNKKKHVLKFSCIFFISELLCGLTQAQAQMDAELLWLYFKSPLSWRSEACLEQRLASTSDYSTHKHTYTLTAIRQSIEANTSEHLTTQLCMREEKRREELIMSVNAWLAQYLNHTTECCTLTGRIWVLQSIKVLKLLCGMLCSIASTSEGINCHKNSTPPIINITLIQRWSRWIAL